MLKNSGVTMLRMIDHERFAHFMLLVNLHYTIMVDRLRVVLPLLSLCEEYIHQDIYISVPIIHQ